MTITELMKLALDNLTLCPSERIAQEWIEKHPPNEAIMREFKLLDSKSEQFKRAFASGASMTDRSRQELAECRYPNLNAFLNEPFC